MAQISSLSCAFLPLLLLAPVVSPLPAHAQAGSYHTELSDGTSGWAVLVNDSTQPIEAFHLSGHCGSLAIGYTHDALEVAGSSTVGPGSPHPSPLVLAPGERLVTDQQLLPQHPTCTWKTEVDAVIYANGTFAGSDAAVRGLQARRDGFAAAIRYWVERLTRESSDRVALGLVSDDLKRLPREDLAKSTAPACRTHPPACDFWAGRHQADATVAARWNPGIDPEQNAKAVLALVARLGSKSDADPAAKILEVTFPLPDDLRAATPDGGASR